MKKVENNMNDIEFNKKMDDRIMQKVPEYLQSRAFQDRKLTDTPTDDLQIVPRKYVNLYGTVRPTSSVVGQHFFDINLASGRGKDITWNGTGWVDATGTYV